MPEVFASLGSNQNREHNIRSAVNALRASFGALTLSPVYRSPAVGFDGDDFLNMVVRFESEYKPEEIQSAFHRIEEQHGRQRGLGSFAPRTLDIDLILYGDSVLKQDGLRLPRSDIEEYNFVLKPLADIAPSYQHPVSGVTYAEMWARNRFAVQLTEVKLEFGSDS